MAAAPPPYSPREQQRRAKEYWRAQRQAARLHQSYWRGFRRSSVTGPIVLILIGIVALLIETGRLNAEAFWLWYREWWPLLLIGIGVVSLLEWLMDRKSQYPVRRSLGGLIFLIIIFSTLCWAGTMSHHWAADGNRLGFFPDDGNPFSFIGKDWENDVDNTQSLPPNSSIQVQDPHGDVTLTASADDHIHVHTHEVVRTPSEGDANRMFRDLDAKVIVSGNSVLVRVDHSSGRADLTIEVPKSATTDITAEHGDVTLEGLAGNANVIAKHGDVKFDGMGGSVNAHIGQGMTNRGDFSAHAIDGDVTLDGGLNDVTISEVKGKALLSGDYFGDTHLERIAKGVHFHSSRTDMEMTSLPGDITLDTDDLHLAQVVGPLSIVTRSKNIDATQTAGDIHIENTNGDVNVVAATPLGNIQIDSHNRPITLTLPPGASFDVNGSTRNGDLSTDYNLNVSGSDNNHTVSGQVGSGGVKIQLDADHGDITVRKGDASLPGVEPLAPLDTIAPPKRPETPAGPGAKVKHLKPHQGSPETPVVQ